MKRKKAEGELQASPDGGSGQCARCHMGRGGRSKSATCGSRKKTGICLNPMSVQNFSANQGGTAKYIRP